MNSEKTSWPLAVTVSSGSSGVSAPVSMLPERWAEQTGVIGHAVMQLFALTPGRQDEVSEVITSRLDTVAQSIEQVYQDANSSVQSVNAALLESGRLVIEGTLQFCLDLAGASGPADAIGLQFGFVQSQAQLFTRQANAIQREMSRFFLSFGPI